MMTQTQLEGILRVVLPVLVGWVATQVPLIGAPGTQGFIVASLTAAGLAIWSAFANSRSGLVGSVEQIRDVKMVVGPNAPVALQAIAKDPERPKVLQLTDTNLVKKLNAGPM
jgi:hypothetical protein